MSDNVPDEERLAPKIDFGNQPVFIPGNVKYHVGLHPVRTPKNLPELWKALPLAASRNAIPIVESRTRVGTSCLELPDCLVANDVHVPPSAHVPITGTSSQALCTISREESGRGRAEGPAKCRFARPAVRRLGFS